MIKDRIIKLANEYFSKMVDIRRNIHMYPEIAFKEYKTSAYIKEILTQLSIPFKEAAKTGIIADIVGDKNGKCVGIRADMDALSMTEENNFSYKSKIPDMMHACGHDAHVACLLGTAMILNDLKKYIKGSVRLIFQPAEEDEGGALPMILEGALDKVDTIVAAHVMSDVPCGKILVKNGAIMASPDDFEIIIKGRGGHGAYPHKVIDPILIGSQVVNALQTIVSRRINPLEPSVISVCYFQAGTSSNVIPDTAVIGGTARSLSYELRENLPKLIEDTIKGIIYSFGADYEFNFRYLYPPTINDEIITKKFATSSEKIIGPENIIWGKEPSMAGEDFAYFAQKVPATFFYLGCGNEEKGITYPIHSSKFDIDEDCLKVGASCFSQFVIDYLND